VQVVKSGVEPPHSKLIIVGDVQVVDLESVDGFYHGWGGGSLEPGSGTPRVLISNVHETMLYGILMHIVEPREI
jgi:hypothetical protein